MAVVAAGGIVDGAGIAEMLRLGAAGVWLGTAFLFTPEAAGRASVWAPRNQDDGRRAASGRRLRGN